MVYTVLRLATPSLAPRKAPLNLVLGGIEITQGKLEFTPGHRIAIIFQCALLLFPTAVFYLMLLIGELYRWLGTGHPGTVYFLLVMGVFLYLGGRILISAIDGPSKLSEISFFAWSMSGLATILTLYCLAKLILWDGSDIDTGSGKGYLIFALGSPLGFCFLHCLYLRLRHW